MKKLLLLLKKLLQLLKKLLLLWKRLTMRWLTMPWQTMLLLLLKKLLLKAKHLKFCFEVLFRNNPVADFSGGVFLFPMSARLVRLSAEPVR